MAPFYPLVFPSMIAKPVKSQDFGGELGELRFDLEFSLQSFRVKQIIYFEVVVELVQLTFSLFQFRAISSFHLRVSSIRAPSEF